MKVSVDRADADYFRQLYEETLAELDELKKAMEDLELERRELQDYCTKLESSE